MQHQYERICEGIRADAEQKCELRERRLLASEARAMKAVARLQAEMAEKERLHQGEWNDLRALHEAQLQAHALEVARFRDEADAQWSVGQAHRGVVDSAHSPASQHALVAQVELSFAEELEVMRAQHEAAGASLRTMLLLESGRLQDARKEVLEVSVSLANERAARQAVLSAGEESGARARQMRAAWERELDGERVRGARREAELMSRVEEMEEREALRRQADGAAAASAETSAALLHELQLLRARHEASVATASERIAACERALRRERHVSAGLRESLEVARDDGQRLRADLGKQSRTHAAARVRATRRKPTPQDADVAGGRRRYLAL